MSVTSSHVTDYSASLRFRPVVPWMSESFRDLSRASHQQLQKHKMAAFAETVPVALFRHDLPLLLLSCSLDSRPYNEVLRPFAAGRVRSARSADHR